jgi:hypothetical protein
VSEEGTTFRLAASGKQRDVQTVTIDPQGTSRYELHLLDQRRRPSHMPAGLTIEVHGNTPPQLALSFPGRDVRVSPLEEVTLEAKLSDDLALASYGVSYGLVRTDRAGQVDQKEHEVRLGGGERTATARSVVPLETLGAGPDDLLSYYFWAEDVAADGTRRRVASDMYYAEVRPFEEHFREGPAPAGGSAGSGGPGGDLARRQKEVLNATWKLEREARDGTVAEALRADVDVVRKGQEDVKKSGEALRVRAMSAALDEALAAMGQAVTRLGEVLSGPPAAGLARAREPEQAAYAALLRMRAREHQVSRGRGAAQGAAEARDQALDELELKQKDSPYETRTEAEAQDQPGREDRQVLSRLRELAERQKALTERLKQLQLAVQQARPAEREEMEQRLKRLREEQQDMLGDLDELLQRLDRPENRTRLAQAREELETTRARASEASEALARGDTGRAVGAGTRAERALDRVREQLQRQVSQGFGDEMRALRAEARRLTRQQASLGEGVRKGAQAGADPRRPAAGTSVTENRRLAEAARGQHAALSALLERMRRTTEEAEASAPLLSRKLYDAIRKAKIDGVERGVDRLGELLDQNQAAQAAAEEPAVARSLAELDQGVGEAAKGVVGDEAEALRAARGELDALLEQARREPAARPGPASGSAAGRAGSTPARRTPGGPAEGSPQAAGGGGGGADAPISGDGYRTFSERLRDVTELLADPALRGDAARVLERTRAMRADLKRHGQVPRWELFDAEVVRPLAELRDKVGEELRRQAPEKERLAPIDRDPVPARFTDLVRRYYESLAGK